MLQIFCIGLEPGDGISSASNDITVKRGTVKFMNNGILFGGHYQLTAREAC
ncbi:MAG TPA: hypothetical protein VN682_09980 [Terriglobales bacterium]|nr:hypothetical protein [Terriglobales bacterium]